MSNYRPPAQVGQTHLLESVMAALPANALMVSSPLQLLEFIEVGEVWHSSDTMTSRLYVHVPTEKACQVKIILYDE